MDFTKHFCSLVSVNAHFGQVLSSNGISKDQEKCNFSSNGPLIYRKAMTSVTPFIMNTHTHTPYYSHIQWLQIDLTVHSDEGVEQKKKESKKTPTSNRQMTGIKFSNEPMTETSERKALGKHHDVKRSMCVQ